MGVHIFNASVTIRNSIAPNGTIKVTASEVHADGAAGGPARALVFSANLVNVKARVFKDNHCLGEAGCSLLIEGTVKADGPLNVEASKSCRYFCFIRQFFIFYLPLHPAKDLRENSMNL